MMLTHCLGIAVRVRAPLAARHHSEHVRRDPETTVCIRNVVIDGVQRAVSVDLIDDREPVPRVCVRDVAAEEAVAVVERDTRATVRVRPVLRGQPLRADAPDPIACIVDGVVSDLRPRRRRGAGSRCPTGRRGCPRSGRCPGTRCRRRSHSATRFSATSVDAARNRIPWFDCTTSFPTIRFERPAPPGPLKTKMPMSVSRTVSCRTLDSLVSSMKTPTAKLRMRPFVMRTPDLPTASMPRAGHRALTVDRVAVQVDRDVVGAHDEPGGAADRDYRLRVRHP